MILVEQLSFEENISQPLVKTSNKKCLHFFLSGKLDVIYDLPVILFFLIDLELDSLKIPHKLLLEFNELLYAFS